MCTVMQGSKHVFCTVIAPFISMNVRILACCVHRMLHGCKGHVVLCTSCWLLVHMCMLVHSVNSGRLHLNDDHEHAWLWMSFPRRRSRVRALQRCATNAAPGEPSPRACRYQWLLASCHAQAGRQPFNDTRLALDVGASLTTVTDDGRPASP